MNPFASWSRFDFVAQLSAGWAPDTLTVILGNVANAYAERASQPKLQQLMAQLRRHDGHCLLHRSSSSSSLVLVVETPKMERLWKVGLS